jgi:hypothetical protein
MLYGNMNIPELPFEWVGGENRVGSGRVEYQVDRTGRLMNGVRYRQPQPSYLSARIAQVSERRLPQMP